jgi:LysM repeat protein
VAEPTTPTVITATAGISIDPTNENGLSSASPSAIQHTVKQGDTLWALGQKYNKSWRDIAKDNNILDPSKLQIGQVLTIKTS